MDKLEHVARAMAVADGLDPDDEMHGGYNTFKLRAVEFNGYALATRGPTWRSYMRQANLLLAGLEAAAAFGETP